MRSWLSTHRPDWHFHAPYLSSYPKVALEQIETLVANVPGPLGFVGSSLGGFWATHFAERLGAKAVLVNPAAMAQNYKLPPTVTSRTSGQGPENAKAPARGQS